MDAVPLAGVPEPVIAGLTTIDVRRLIWLDDEFLQLLHRGGQRLHVDEGHRGVVLLKFLQQLCRQRFRRRVAEVGCVAEQLVVYEHTNADALELAQVGLYRAVVPKGRYRTGEHAIYIPEGSLLPTELIEELELTGRLAGGKHNRVRAVRLRGELSQGIVCRPAALVDVDLAQAHAEDRDFAAELGVTKWVPPVPTHFGATSSPRPTCWAGSRSRTSSATRTCFAPGEPVVATEKVHGSACLYTLVRDGEASARRT